MDIRMIETALLEQKEEFKNSLEINYCSRSEEELVELDSNMA